MTVATKKASIDRAKRVASVFALLASTALATSWAPAHAADAPSASGPVAVTTEVVVTAERRETSVLKAPASIAAINQTEMAERNITNVKDLVAQVPGVMIGSNAGYTLLSVRGISTTDPRTDASVALYEDGVYSARQYSPNLSYVDLSRVEVLRGPQGALYGRNATGGVIAYYSAAPTKDFEGRASLLEGSYNRFRSELMLSGPVAPNIQLRAAAFYEERDGYYTNIVNGQNLGKHRDWGVRLRAHADLTSTLSIDVIGRHGEQIGSDVIASLVAPLPPPAFALVPQFAGAIVSNEPFRVSQNQDGVNQIQRSNTVTAIAKWRVTDGVTLVGQTAWSLGKEDRRGYDSDATSFEATHSRLRSKDQTYQNDLYVDGTTGRFHTLTGVSFYNEKYFTAVNTELAPVARFGSLPVGTTNLVQLNQNTSSVAVFTDDLYHVTDRFRLSAGVRANWDKRDAVRSAGASLPILPGYGLPNTPVPGPINPATGAPTSGICINKSAEAKFDSTVFKGGAQYDVNDRNMAYASVNEGFKAGGFNGADCGPPFRPEKIISYEVGIKGRLFDSRLTYELAAYHYDYTDLQVMQIIGVSGVITNAGTASADGLDITLAAALTSSLRVDATAGLVDAKYDDYCSPKDPVYPGGFPGVPGAYPLDCTIPGSSPPALGTQVKGTRLNRAPAFQGTLGVSYENDIPGVGRLSLRGEVFHTSDVVMRVFPRDPGATQKEYTLLSAYASLKPSILKGVTVSAFVKNLGDKVYTVWNQNIQFANSYSVYGEPRTYGVQLAYDF